MSIPPEYSHTTDLRSESGIIGWGLIIVIAILVLAVIGLFAVCGGNS